MVPQSLTTMKGHCQGGLRKIRIQEGCGKHIKTTISCFKRFCHVTLSVYWHIVVKNKNINSMYFSVPSHISHILQFFKAWCYTTKSSQNVSKAQYLSVISTAYILVFQAIVVVHKQSYLNISQKLQFFKAWHYTRKSPHKFSKPYIVVLQVVCYIVYNQSY